MVDALRKLSTSYACPILHGLFEKLRKNNTNITDLSKKSLQWAMNRLDFCLLPTAYCLLPTAYCLLPTDGCKLLSRPQH